MPTLRKTPIRSLKSFGVAGLLAEKSHVFYQSIFSPVQLGQFTDLINARLKKSGYDELKFRTLILISVYEAYRCATGNAQENIQPIRLESGIDDERFAFGVAFSLPLTQSIENLKKEIETNFKSLLTQVDELVVRVHPETRRVEIVSLLALHSDREASSPLSVLQWVSLAANEVEETPQVRDYTEMGDLDYTGLLEDQVKLKQDRKSIQQEFLIKGDGAQLDERAVRIGAGDLDLGDDERRIVKGSGSKKESLFKKIWPFKKASSNDPEEEDESPSKTKEPLLSAHSSLQSPEPLDPKVEAKVLDSEEVAQVLTQELESGGLDQVISRIGDELPELKKALDSPRLKRWLDHFSRDLITEKSKIKELMKDMTVSIRHKDIEFNTKILAMKEELRKQGEVLAQKENALTRSREQFIQAGKTMEKVKQINQGGPEEAQFKQKYVMSQKVLTNKKEENIQLLAKIDQLKSQIANLQLASQPKASQAQELHALQNKYDRLQHQLEEFKRVNQTLVSQVAQSSSRASADASSGNEVEFKRKLEIANKVSIHAKKESDLLRTKIERMRVNEKNLQQELTKLQALVRNSRKAGGGNSSSEAA